MFEDMIADMVSNKEFSLIVTEMVFKRKKTQYFTCFCFIILFQSVSNQMQLIIVS